MEEQLLRAIANSGAVRVLSAVTTELVTEAASKLGLNGDVTNAFGRLMTGTALIRSTIHPDERLQVTMRHNGPAGDLMADVWANGMIRGRAQVVDASSEEKWPLGVVGDLGVVEVARSRKQNAGQIHQSVTMMITGTIQDELQLFLLESEQIASNLQLEVCLDKDGKIVWAGGVLFQLLPEASNDDLRRIVEKIDGFESLYSLWSEDDPTSLLTGVMPEGMEYTVVGEESLYFGCSCNEERVMHSLSTLPKEEIQGLITAGEPVELSCGFCNKNYLIQPENLKPLLEEG